MWRLREAAIKELRFLRTQPVFALIGLFSPFVMFLVFLLLVGGDISLPLVAVAPTQPAAASFTHHLEDFSTPHGIRYVDLSLVRDDEEGLARVKAVEVPALLVTSEDFGEASGEGIRIYRLDLWYGFINQNLVKNVLDRVNGALVDYVEDSQLAASGRAVEVVESNRYDRDIGWLSFMVTGLYVYAVSLAASVTAGSALTKEFEAGTFRLFRLAPPRAWLVLAAKLVPGVVLALAAGGLMAVASLPLTELAFGFHPELLLLASLLTAGIAGGLGLLLGAVLRQTVPTFIAALLSNLSLWLLGGGFGRPSLFPAPLPLLSRLIPTRYAVQAVQSLTLDRTTTDLGGSLAILTIFLLVILALANASISRRLGKVG